MGCTFRQSGSRLNILICYSAVPLYIHLLCALNCTKQIQRKYVEIIKGKTNDTHGDKRLFSGGIGTSQFDSWFYYYNLDDLLHLLFLFGLSILF